MAVERPLSPHLQVYRPQLTTSLSILHRITGLLLSLGGVLLVGWVLILAQGPDHYGHLQEWARHGVIKWLVCAGFYVFVFSLTYHLLNGIRHLVWDAGYGLDIPSAYRSGWTVVVLSLVFTALLAVRAMTGGAA